MSSTNNKCHGNHKFEENGLGKQMSKKILSHHQERCRPTHTHTQLHGEKWQHHYYCWTKCQHFNSQRCPVKGHMFASINQTRRQHHTNGNGVNICGHCLRGQVKDDHRASMFLLPIVCFSMFLQTQQIFMKRLCIWVGVAISM